MNKRRISFFLMCIVVCLWGLDYSVAKCALDVFKPLNLMFFKYAGGFVTITVLKIISGSKFTIRKKDILFFILCSLTGQVLYYFCEYTAMKYIHVSLITIILAFVPIISIIIERIVFKKKLTVKILAGLIGCVVGVVLIIGKDLQMMLGGKALGYLLAFGAVLSWNIYNFITARISKEYDSLTMAFNQFLCTVLISMPYVIKVMPPAEQFTPSIIISIAYLGLISAGIGSLIYIKSIAALGPTISAVFTNFVPVTSTVFGWIILGQNLSLLQLVGEAIVIIFSCFVITEKGKLE